MQKIAWNEKMLSRKRGHFFCDYIRGKMTMFAVPAATQSRVHLEPLSQKLKQDITDERGYCGNFTIGRGNDIANGPR
jgi:hypothetical protein